MYSWLTHLQHNFFIQVDRNMKCAIIIHHVEFMSILYYFWIKIDSNNQKREFGNIEFISSIYLFQFILVY